MIRLRLLLLASIIAFGSLGNASEVNIQPKKLTDNELDQVVAGSQFWQEIRDTVIIPTSVFVARTAVGVAGSAASALGQVLRPTTLQAPDVGDDLDERFTGWIGGLRALPNWLPSTSPNGPVSPIPGSDMWY